MIPRFKSAARGASNAAHLPTPSAAVRILGFRKAAGSVSGFFSSGREGREGREGEEDLWEASAWIRSAMTFSALDCIAMANQAERVR